MNLKRRRASFMESSVLSDLAFLLIIYFIVIAGFNVNRGFLLNLPQKDSVKMVQRDELLRFALDKNGRVLFSGRALSYGQAEAEIRAAVAARPNLAVVLTVSPSASWQSVVSFIDLAQKNAVDSFSFSMEKTGKGESAGDLP